MKSDHIIKIDTCAADIGYFSSKFTYGRRIVDDKAVIVTGLFPSLAPRLPSDVSPRTALQSKADGTVVEVNDVNYYVGRDAVLYSSGREPREVLSDYCMTDKYMALLYGVFHYLMKDAEAEAELVIGRLVLGLPLSTFAKYKSGLENKVTGEHMLPTLASENGKRRVTVEQCTVIVQPQGALMNYGFHVNKEVFLETWSLVLDPGGGTLDWYLTKGRQPNWQRSGAYEKSMLACAYAVSDRISPTWRDNYEIIERIDKTIRDGGKSFTVAGEVYEMGDFKPAIEAVLKESTDKMLSKVSSLDSLDMILFTGGGAKLFYEFMARNYPKHKKIMFIDEEPVFSNVKGFQLAGELMASAPKR